jgi:5,10-methenyltetrahydromethanopterin hydrogenase
MDAKKKLVELANDVLQYLPWGEIQKDTAEQIADRMMDHGVTVQACKIGDQIYQVDGVQTYESTVQEITITAEHTIFVTENVAFDERAIGKSIFLTFSEAKEHLHRSEEA